VVGPIIKLVAVVPEFMVTPDANVMFPKVVSLSPAGLPVEVVDRSADVAALLFAVIEIAPLVVETFALIKILRPAATVKELPELVIASALLKITSEFACKVILAAAATILAGVMVLVPAALLANKLFVPAL